jgi:hypothetical protein
MNGWVVDGWSVVSRGETVGRGEGAEPCRKEIEEIEECKVYTDFAD